MRSIIRIAVLAAAVVLMTTGCGVKTAYNNADWLLMRSINERVSLSDEQEREVNALLEESLAWHCASELPDYAAFLRQVDEDMVAGRFSRPTLEGYGQTVSDFGRRLLAKLRPAVVDLLAGLSDEQVDELAASFEERNNELIEEAESYFDESSITERAEGFEKGMRRLSGRLTDEQRERLMTWSRALQPSAALTLQRRLRWQAEFRRVMAIRADRDRFDRAMTELLQPDLFMSDALAQRREHNRILTLEAAVDIHRLAPEEQVEALRENLAGLSEDLEQLSCSG
ncbi:DUF6279 family lipoprotein [Wenzhouxiangella sediminis]|uniref:Lipoprotein n=1 Tax=Wenzhouxiangella sediminis TaxID=1792836 RepID=A0A3E1KAB5_9GAMM|nr:DUF6279 family lipoprotein [Wenzhouxiangella sediminis]RFF31257.1 hypothetical protein DZC52_05425 [Wenzhouxiangella sediminis]